MRSTFGLAALLAAGLAGKSPCIIRQIAGKKEAFSLSHEYCTERHHDVARVEPGREGGNR